jgi:hypothetical protein
VSSNVPPEVRERIARGAAAAPKGATGEQYLELFDKAFSPKVPLKAVVEVVAPLYARWGIGTGKSRSVILPLPPGRVLVAALCWLAGSGRALRQIRQADDGCVLEARLPSDLFSLEGELVISIRRVAEGTQVEAATRIPGQLVDWGKSTRSLTGLFEALKAA